MKQIITKRFLFLLLLFIVISDVNSTEIENAEAVNNKIGLAVNLISNGNSYSTSGYTDADLNTLLPMLKDNYIKQISIRVIWAIMESGSQKNYNTTAIGHLNRILTKADQYGLDVMLDFHTLFNSGDQSWQAPSWLTAIAPARTVNGESVPAGSMRHIFYTDTVRAAYTNMMKYVIERVQNHSSLKYISLMNEPWLNWDSNSNITYFDNTVTYMLGKLRPITNKPISVRFLPSWNPWGDQSKKRIGTTIWKQLDYIGMNQYFEDNSSLVKDGTLFWPMVQRALNAIHAENKILIATECGFSTGTNASYESRWRAIIQNRFNTYKPDIIQIWDGQNDMAYFNSTNGSFNIFKAKNTLADYLTNTLIPELKKINGESISAINNINAYQPKINIYNNRIEVDDEIKSMNLINLLGQTVTQSRANFLDVSGMDGIYIIQVTSIIDEVFFKKISLKN